MNNAFGDGVSIDEAQAAARRDGMESGKNRALANHSRHPVEYLWPEPRSCTLLITRVD